MHVFVTDIITDRVDESYVGNRGYRQRVHLLCA